MILRIFVIVSGLLVLGFLVMVILVLENYFSITDKENKDFNIYGNPIGWVIGLCISIGLFLHLCTFKTPI